MNIYIVNHYYGEYEDASTDSIKAFHDKEKAEDFISNLEARKKVVSKIRDQVYLIRNEYYDKIITLRSKNEIEKNQIERELKVRENVLDKLTPEELSDYGFFFDDSSFGIVEIEFVE